MKSEYQYCIIIIFCNFSAKFYCKYEILKKKEKLVLRQGSRIIEKETMNYR